jgi:alkaline phosphatase D
MEQTNMSENTSGVFIHGVASGDPLQDRVIIWTRVTTTTNEPVQVNWKMGRDRNFNGLVASGTALAQRDADFTVKVDVTGLNPGTHYFYQFAASGETSPVGRTKTLPPDGTKHIRFAQVSCARYDAGFFNAYAKIAEREDLEFVLHLGDYIYEIAEKLPEAQIVGDRLFDPLHECKTLVDYRRRYAQYRRDPAVQKMHAALPIIATMDDHELANDAWRDGAGEHNPEVDGDWAIRRATAFRVRWEWLPARMPDPADPERVFRKVSLGGLADLLLVETRSRRDLPVTGEAMYDSHRSALGQQQREWLFSELENSTATWRMLGCPSVLSPTWSPTLPESLQKPLVKVKLIDADTFGPASDQWDGYPVERDRLLGLIQEKAIENVVVLSGDVHVGLAMELKRHAFNRDEAPIGVEFVTTSVASFNLDDKMGWEPRTKSKPIQAELIKAIPHIKWCDLDSHGYNIIDVTPAQVTAQWRFVDTVLQPSAQEMSGASFMVKAGCPQLMAIESRM